MVARREITYAFEVEGRLARSDIAGTLLVRLEHSMPIDSSLAWFPPLWVFPSVVKSVLQGQGALTASLIKAVQTQMLLPGQSVMKVGASYEGKLFEYRGGKWSMSWRPATELRVGTASESSPIYLRKSAKGSEVVFERNGSLPASDVNLNLLFVEIDRINYGKYISALVCSPLDVLKFTLVGVLGIGFWIVVILFFFGMR